MVNGTILTNPRPQLILAQVPPRACHNAGCIRWMSTIRDPYEPQKH